MDVLGLLGVLRVFRIFTVSRASGPFLEGFLVCLGFLEFVVSRGFEGFRAAGFKVYRVQRVARIWVI